MGKALLFGSSVVWVLVAGFASPAQAQTYIQPGYEIVSNPPVYSQPISGTVITSPVVQHYPSAPIYSSESVTYAQPTDTYSSGGVSNVLAMVNSQRSRNGVFALMPDATLQAVAQRRAQQMASMGIKNHPPGSFSPGRYEGVGWSSTFSPTGVAACYTNSTSMRYAGAAMATGRDGVYFVVVYR